MIKIGLTGGMGAGKSTAAHILSKLGAPVISADHLGHEAYRKGTRVYEEVAEAFGPGVLAADGEIDRRKLGQIVFSDPERRRELESIVWPEIRREISARFAEHKEDRTKVAVLEAALLFEAGWDDLVDQVWVIDSPRDQAVKRLQAKTGLSEGDIRARMDAQLMPEQRARRATVLINNDADLQALESRVTAAWEGLAGKET